MVIIATKDEMLKHLDAAIQLEQEGVKKYTEFSKETQNYYGKLMFERLTIEEEKHALILESWKEKLDKMQLEKEFAETTKLESINAVEIFPTTARTTKGITKDYISALTYAIDIEEKSSHFYKELEQLAENLELKKLFEDLSKFEQEHVHLLKTELDFVQSNPMSFH